MSTAQTVIDQKLAQFGWVESIATNSINDFKLTTLSFVEPVSDERKAYFLTLLSFNVYSI